MSDLLTGLDLPEEVKETLSTRIEDAKNKWIEGAKNDPDFITKIRKEESGKFFKSMEGVLKRNLNVKPDDLEGDLTGLKRQEALLKLGIQSFEKNKDATATQLQEELIKVRSDFDKFRDVDHVNALNQVKSIYNGKLIDAKMFEDAASIEVTCSEKAKVPLINSFLSANNYQKLWNDETGDYEIMTKDATPLKPLRDGKPLSKEEILKDAFEFAGVFKQSNGSGEGRREEGQQRQRQTGKLSANAQAMMDSFKS